MFPVAATDTSNYSAPQTSGSDFATLLLARLMNNLPNFLTIYGTRFTFSVNGQGLVLYILGYSRKGNFSQISENRKYTFS